jgi:phage-related minor tail protein
VDVGTLVGYMEIQDSGFKFGLGSAERSFDRFADSLDSDLAALERDFDDAGDDIMDQLEQSFRELDDVVEKAFRDAEQAAERSGRRIGDALEDGVDSGVDGARQAAGRGGEQAGEEFSGGLGESGRSGASAAGMDMMGSLKGLGWAAAGAAIGAVLIAGFTKALDTEVAVDKLAAQIGATPEMSRDFGRIAGELYADAYGESVGDVAEALRGVWQSGLVPEDTALDEIERITAKAMNFATVIGEDVTKATRAAAKMIKTGLVDNAEQAFDILTRGVQQGANEAEDLLDTFSEYSTMFRDIGLSGDQAMGLISQGLRAGARDSDTVADALKEFAIRAQDASTTSAAGFEAIGLNAKEMTSIFAQGGPEAAKALDTVLDRLRNMKDPVERNAAAVALFGTKAEDLADSLFALDPSEAVAALGQVEGAADRMGETLADNASTRIESFKRTMEQGLVNFIGNNVLPSLSALMDGLKLSGVPQAIENIVTQGRELIDGIVQDVRDWAATHGEQIDRIVAGGKRLYDEVTKAASETISFIKDLWESADWIDVIATKIEASIRIIEGLVEMVRGVVQLVAGILTGDWSKAWSGIQAIVEGALDATVGIIDNLVGGLVELLGGNWQEIKDSAKRAWDGTVQLFKDAGQWISDALSWITALPGKVGTWFGQVKDAAVDKLEALGTWVTVELPARIGAGLSSLGEKMKGWISIGLEGLKWALTEGIEWAIAWAIALPFKLVEAGAELGAKIREWIGNAWQSAKDLAVTKTTELLEWAQGVPGQIIEAVSELNAKIGEWASAAWQNAKDTAARKGQELLDWARGLPGRILASISDLNARVGEWARNAWQNAKTGAEEKGRELVQWAKELPGRIVSEIGELGSKLWSTGRDLIEGLIRGIKETAGRIADAVLGPIRDTIAKTKSLLGISSPSKVMAEIGVNMGEGLALGIESTKGLVADSLAGLAEQAQGFGAQLAMGMTSSGARLPVATPGVEGSSGAGTAGSNSGPPRSLVHIENYHPPKPDDPWATAQDLDWISKAGG